MGTDNAQEKKPYCITFQPRDGYLQIYVSGEEDNQEISLAYWIDIAQYCWEHGVSKILVEEDFKTDNTLLGTYEFISQGDASNFSKIKIAFIDRHPEQAATNLFGETVAQNRGISVKIFSDIQEAEKWLLS
jgi:hypothetical protein